MWDDKIARAYKYLYKYILLMCKMKALSMVVSSLIYETFNQKQSIWCIGMPPNTGVQATRVPLRSATLHCAPRERLTPAVKPHAVSCGMVQNRLRSE